MVKGELFSTDMMCAILERRKKHTCRPIKPQHKRNFISTDWRGIPCEWLKIDIETKQFVASAKPKYLPGDYMYCREAWGIISGGLYVYKADGETIDHLGNLIKWKPSIHMPREAARLFFKVTNVEMMRLEEVSEAFAVEDGFLPTGVGHAKRAFYRFWKQTYGSDSRWMWVYWMEPVTKEESLII